MNGDRGNKASLATVVRMQGRWGRGLKAVMTHQHDVRCDDGDCFKQLLSLSLLTGKLDLNRKGEISLEVVVVGEQELYNSGPID